ncbi:MAG: FAD binding domain-containing protein [Proteobacteria bacterium]|nr:FAD binding domain-containing protein [Pseudomonadota bacterium]
MSGVHAFHRPTSLSALRTLLAGLHAQGERYLLCAGATDLMPQLQRDLLRPRALVSLTGLAELAQIERLPEGGLRIGATVSLATIASDPRVRADWPALAAVAARVASAPIRQRASLGGNLLVDNRCSYYDQSPTNRSCHGPCFKAGGEVCHIVKSARRGQSPLCQARFVSDTAPVLLLLGARVHLLGTDGPRQLALAELYRDDGIERLALHAGEVLAAIEVPAGHWQIAYDKLAIRGTLDFPSLGIAVGLHEGDAGPDRYALAMTGIGVRPGHWSFALPADAAPGQLQAQAIAAAGAHAAVYDQDYFPRDYRKRMIEVFVRRLTRRIGAERWT